MPGCTMIILSDANTVFITEILEHHQLLQHITQASCRFKIDHLPKPVMACLSASPSAHAALQQRGTTKAEHC